MSTSAVAVGVTGRTVILETHAGRNKLIVLEGSARVSLNKNRSESVYVRGGQMEDVPAGANKLPPPVNVNLAEIMQHHPLITGFGPLPSRDLIMATASAPIVYQGGPVDEPPGPAHSFLPSLLPSVGLGVIPIGGGHGGGSHVRRTPVDAGRRGTRANQIPAKIHPTTRRSERLLEQAVATQPRHLRRERRRIKARNLNSPLAENFCRLRDSAGFTAG